MPLSTRFSQLLATLLTILAPWNMHTAYADDAMKRDVVALFDHLGLDDVLLVGYSMGAHLSLRLAPDEPRIKALVLLGIGNPGSGGESGPDRRDALVAVLEADSPDDVDDASLRQFRVVLDLIDDL